MRVVIQRVCAASVAVDGQIVGKIGQGLLVLAGFDDADKDSDLEWVAGKIVRMRIFADAGGVMNHSVTDVDGEILLVSQFTLYASLKKGNRPSWSRAAKGSVSQPLFEQLAVNLSAKIGKPVEVGVFGADMSVSLVNDGPVTICLDSRHPE